MKKPQPWPGLARRFRSLVTPQAETRPLTAFEDTSGEDHKFGKWVFPPSLRTAAVLARFEEVARRAGRCLGAPLDVDPLDFWLDRLSLYLWGHDNGRGLKILSCAE